MHNTDMYLYHTVELFQVAFSPGLSHSVRLLGLDLDPATPNRQTGDARLMIGFN